MKDNKTISLGGIILLEKVEKEFGVFSELFSGPGGKAKDFVSCAKPHVYNKLTHSVSINQILEAYPEEITQYLGMKELPTKRSLYRTLERLMKYFPVLLDRHQNLIKKHNLVDSNQLLDFSSTYFEGKKARFGRVGLFKRP